MGQSRGDIKKDLVAWAVWQAQTAAIGISSEARAGLFAFILTNHQ